MFSDAQLTNHTRLVACLAVIIAIAAVPFSIGRPVRAQEGAFDPAAFAVGFELVAEGLTRPVQIVDANDESGRSFIVEQGGTIRVLSNGVVQDDPFLDISGQVTSGSEQGLLSMALHPGFAENGTFFIDYTDLDGNTQIERWQVSGDDPNRANPESVQTIMTVEQPFPNHNGGLLLFGPDAYLYIGLGDGGSQGDPNGNGQDLSTLLGSILRIDVDSTSGDLPYGIPEDNPFVNEEGARPEIWLYGLRNPWRFSFDRESSDLFIGDVGGTAYEEVDLFPAGSDGRNFGWNIMEGPECYQGGECDQSGLELPIFAYTHDEGGCSITGGYIYRGTEIPELQGVYLTADYCSGQLWGIGLNEGGEWVASAPIETGLNVSSFGEGANGELYVVDLSGGVYRVTAAD
jgi:glucose/arabinose dehydrogenase